MRVGGGDIIYPAFGKRRGFLPVATMKKTDVIINVSMTDAEEFLRRSGVVVADGALALKARELREAGARASLRRLRRLRAGNIYIIVDNLKERWRMFYLKLFARLAGAERVVVFGALGGEEEATWGDTLAECARFLFARAAGCAVVAAHAPALWVGCALAPRRGRRLDPARARSVVYLRPEQYFEVVAGGVLARIMGVNNTLEKLGFTVHTTTCFPIENVRLPRTRTVIEPSGFIAEMLEANIALNSWTLYRALAARWRRMNPGWFYHRYSMNNFTGPLAAILKRVPLVVEFNDSAVWAERNWGGFMFMFPWFTELVERFVTRQADVVTVISKVLRDQLVEKGVPPEKILVNPVAVNPDDYRYEDHRARAVEWRRGIGIPDDAVVAGFVGSFGLWHGAEVLAAAAPMVLERVPNAHFLLVGEGKRYTETMKAARESGCADRIHLTGWVPQSDGPMAMAACDVLASPHVPNPDGTPFHGSPMKLFEYMSMGRGIVASDLDQIGEILEDGVTAVLVKPGDAAALADGVARLCLDPELRRRLGENARRAAMERHTWEMHIRKILDKLEERCGKAINEKRITK